VVEVIDAESAGDGLFVLATSVRKGGMRREQGQLLLEAGLEDLELLLGHFSLLVLLKGLGNGLAHLGHVR
jgi:hypothetical protein